MESQLDLPGVGKQITKYLNRLGIYSVLDLLLHLPSNYQNRSNLTSIHQLVLGNDALIEGVIHSVSHPTGGKTKLLCEIKDGTGRLYLRFFHLLSFQLNALTPSTRLRCYGVLRLGPKGREMVHPEFQVIYPNKEVPFDPYLTSIYPTTEGLSQYTLRKLIQNAFTWLENQPDRSELLPAPLLNNLSLPAFKEALAFVHRPPCDTPIMDLLENNTIAQKRLVFEELLAHRMSLLQNRKQFLSKKAEALVKYKKLAGAFKKQLPFELTRAQNKVIEEIHQDLVRPVPMLRLVQGDVGSGKTVVAAFAMLQAIENGYQAVLMAPTELLAEQHYRVFERWFAPMGIRLTFLSGQVKANKRAMVLNAIATGDAQIILGTHALFQEEVNFAKLALLVIDEQHRFGVHQRALLRKKALQSGHYPHQLIMTATPIPRTLAMSYYADLDCSIIDELPSGRIKVATHVIANNKREAVILRIREACHQGKQAYWVCPFIEESEVKPGQAATKTAEEFKALFPDLKLGLIHGRINADDKECIMRAFQQGEIHLLVATTVIEVGVDVPNASIIVIENAERLGLSQLHQLRGRVGRGDLASHCIMLYQAPLSPIAQKRLSVMRETTDGFKIAQFDLELRGPGEVLGTKQTGDFAFRVADLMRDQDLLPIVQKCAELLIHGNDAIIALLIERWLGRGKDYGTL